jgi:hypothetical protein
VIHLPIGAWAFLVRALCTFAAAVLLLAGLAKLISSAGSSDLLAWVDPVLGMKTRYVFMIAGSFEAALSAYLLWGRKPHVKLILIACTAGEFTLYRLCLWWLGSPHPCKCLGNALDWLHLPSGYVDYSLRGFIIVTLIGSCALLVTSPRLEAAGSV